MLTTKVMVALMKRAADHDQGCRLSQEGEPSGKRCVYREMMS